jgi:hypothetical protein
MRLDPSPPAAGLTVADVAKRYRVSPDKVRRWIDRGELLAVNTAEALCGKPRYVITAEALAEFERRRSTAPPPKPKRRKKSPVMMDYFP